MMKNSRNNQAKASPRKGKLPVKDEPASSTDEKSSLLEKGIIYFFFRPRVNVEEPQSVDEVAAVILSCDHYRLTQNSEKGLLRTRIMLDSSSCPRNPSPKRLEIASYLLLTRQKLPLRKLKRIFLY